MGIELTVLMPCLNEAETLATCIRKAHQGAKNAGVDFYEILVADNGSTDGSKDIAKREGARVIDVEVRGYGAALKAGVENAEGKYIIMGDSDDSYDFINLSRFVKKLREGYELVMGSRLKGEIKPGAMPFLHRYLGNPVLTFIGNLFYNCGLSDFHCGMRGFSKESVLNLDLRTDGMEFASEMVIRATLAELKRTEVPITLHPDSRTRPPHLRTWRDGWRHLRFMLLYSPRWLFFYPGVVFTVTGLIIWLLLIKGEMQISGIVFDVHTMLAGVTMIIIGTLLMMMAGFVRLYAARLKLLPEQAWLENIINKFSLEYGLIVGIVLTILGVGMYAGGLAVWQRSSFGPLDYQTTLRIIISGTLFVVVGAQVFFSSFIISLLGIQHKDTT